MSISALFPGMGAYLDGDVEINNNVGAADTDDTDFVLTKEWCTSVLKDTISKYNIKYKLAIAGVRIELSGQPRYTNGKICNNPEIMKAYGGCWTSKKIIYINPYAINAYCYISKVNIRDVKIGEFHSFIKFLIAHELAHGVWQYYSDKKFKDKIGQSAKDENFGTNYLEWVKQNNPDRLEEETFCEYMASSIKK